MKKGIDKQDKVTKKVEEEEEEEQEIEKIVSHRINNQNQVEFLIQWKGYHLKTYIDYKSLTINTNVWAYEYFKSK